MGGTDLHFENTNFKLDCLQRGSITAKGCRPFLSAADALCLSSTPKQTGRKFLRLIAKNYPPNFSVPGGQNWELVHFTVVTISVTTLEDGRS
ncbi:hypothetical protein NPIL_434581 [Nephila pilipes]|uniref:Uncharacterized protein n=1 Tax=Nephila pilipes TaxID=299642 RepID=A0A8X6ULE5_NEPPI|nr:hypothetical protein NPIL_434581 [Nephila pilipes]